MTTETDPAGVRHLHPVPDPADGTPPSPPAPPADVTAAAWDEPPERRRDIIPEHWRPANLKTTVAIIAGKRLYQCAYHGVRLPLHAVTLVICAVRGASRLTRRLMTWWHVPHLHALESMAVAAGRAGHHDAMRAHTEGKKTRATRGTIIALCAGAVLVVLVVALAVLPWYGWAVLLAAGFVILVRRGRPEGKPIIGAAIVAPRYEPPTPEIITRALNSLGIKGITDVIKDGRRLDFITDVHRDGPGWGVQLDLPHGVTAVNVIARRVELASGLRRPLSATWPTEVPEVHTGRLDLWIAFQDLAKAKQPPWPLLRSGQADVFSGVPFGTDPRQRTVSVPMFEVNWLVGASPGQGKALALDTPVPTPSGWTTMGELRDGDTVFAADGQPCTVERAWPVRYDRPCYEVEFSDGTVIVADAEHRWLVDTRKSRQATAKGRLGAPQVVTTAGMLPSLRLTDGNRANYSVRVTRAIQAPEADLPVPPYMLGVWLGDGTTAKGEFTSPDAEVVAGVEAEGETCIRQTYPSAEGKCPQYRVRGLTSRLRQLGVLGSKHIPVEYLRASEDQRRALLAGLLDTDGFCQASNREGRRAGQVYFAVTCERLARDTRHLISTLGYKSSINVKPAKLNGRDMGLQWVVTFTPPDKVFRMQRKAERQILDTRATCWHRYITAIRPIPSVPVRCITVDSPERLYLVGETCVPTHNTGSVRVLGCAAALDPLADIWVHELAGKGDLDLSRVCHRYCSGIDDEAIEYAAMSASMLRKETERRAARFKKLKGTGVMPDGKVTRELAGKYRDLRPLVAIFDEAQNLFMHEACKKQAAADLAYVIRVGRAYGIIVILSTQRPNDESVPAAVSGLIICRYCLMVPGHIENDMVLGTSAFKNGYKATMFRPKVDAGMGWLKGSEDGIPQIVKSYYLNLKATERIITRARAIREAAGVLSGYALGEDDGDTGPRDVLSDVLSVFGLDPGLHWETLAERLAAQIPERWADVTADSVSAQCRGLGVPSVQVKVAGIGLKGCRRADVVDAREQA